MAKCEHGHDHDDFEEGVFDLLELAQSLRHGEAWEKAKELGLATDGPTGDEWRMTQQGAQICALAMLLNLEIVLDGLETEEEQQQWREQMMTMMGRVVLSMTRFGLLHKEVTAAMEALKAEMTDRTKQRQAGAVQSPWVELH